MQAPPRSDQLQCYHPLLGQPGKYSRWAEFGAVHMVLCFACKDKRPGVWVFTDSWIVANGLAGWSGTWKEHHRKIGEKDICRRNMWTELSKWTKHVKTLQFQVNAHQKMTSAQELIIIHRITHSVDSQPLSPVIPALVIAGLWPVALVAKMEVM